ncbi:N-acetylmuramoyl-L-alanine amidase [Candidatus Peribacteria bacterium]|nr:N-acetylmuramoyl-L-alanine amidase [Candidatus Peribacteria bacterium]
MNRPLTALLALVLSGASVMPPTMAAEMALYDNNAAAFEQAVVDTKTDTPPRFITREEWGAGADPVRSRSSWATGWIGNRFYAEESNLFPADKRPSVFLDTNELGQPLEWPIYHDTGKDIIVVHHTVSEDIPIDQGDMPAIKQVRSIWDFHTNSRGWGDIGYNFLIDKLGNIYEGRRGGSDAVGAGATGVNVRALHIALIGNFQVTTPSGPQLTSLKLLSAYLANKYSIDVDNEAVEFGGRTLPALGGHRDVALLGHGTACPGEHLHDLIDSLKPQIKELQLLLKDDGSLPVTREFLRQTTSAKQLVRRKVQTPESQIPIKLGKLLKAQPIARNSEGSLSIVVENLTKSFLWKKGVALTTLQQPKGVTLTNFIAMEDIAPGKKGEFRASYIVTGEADLGDKIIELSPDFLEGKVTYHRRNSIIAVPITVVGSTQTLTREAAGGLKQLTGSVSEMNPKAGIASHLQASLIRPTATGRTSSIRSTAASAIAGRRVSSAAFGSLDLQPMLSAAPTVSSIPTPPTSTEPLVRINISTFTSAYAKVTADSPMTVTVAGGQSASVPTGQELTLNYTNANGRGEVTATVGDTELRGAHLTLTAGWNGVLTVHNYNRGISNSLAYNRFLNTLKFYPEESHLLLVNELGVEQYLNGVSEEPSNEPLEKKHAIWVATRGYILAYSKSMGWKQKFPGEWRYDMQDLPSCCVFYLGHQWTENNDSQIALVADTRGMTPTYEGKPAILPYYSSSAGKGSASWKSQYPYLKELTLPYDVGQPERGHLNGMSAYTAKQLALRDGYDYKQIIDFFFDGIEIEQLY